MGCVFRQFAGDFQFSAIFFMEAAASGNEGDIEWDSVFGGRVPGRVFLPHQAQLGM
jgi:hypothetical protein